MKNTLLQVLIFFVVTTSLFAQKILINEVVSSNITGICDSTGSKNDWVELYNPNPYPVNLYGYSLSDNDEHVEKWLFPNVSISPKGYVLVFASEAEAIESQLHCNFKLAKEGEVLSLYSSQGQLVDQVTIPALDDDLSYGRNQNGGNDFHYYAIPTPGSKNDSYPYKGFIAKKPMFTTAAGFYQQSISVSAEHEDEKTILRYTTDGSEPQANSPVLNQPITISNRSYEPNYFSLIKTNPSFLYPKPGFDENRANNRGWLPPYSDVTKGTVFKVRAFKSNLIPSPSASSSYFVFPEGNKRYTYPILSITTDEDNFFDDKKGIYVYGSTGEEGNYKESGCEWERPVDVQYFEDDGTLAFQQQMGARIHGGGGRHSTVKNIRLYARDEYGKSKVKYDFFNDPENDEFERLLVRGPGHRPDCTPRDDFADLLLQNQAMDVQHLHHVVVFLNGEYWGLHTIKERFDLDYLANKYGKEDDDYVIMKNSGSLDKGEVDDDQHYFDLLEYIEHHDMRLPEHYNYVKTQIDIDNYVSFLAAEIYMGNVDWLITNIKFWRYKGDKVNTEVLNPLDGRWRWFMFDFDLVFGGSCDNINPNVHIMRDVFDPEFGKATILPRGLKQNSEFERLFVNRLCDQMNSMFSEQNFRKRLHEIDSMMTPGMLEHVQRWRYPSVSKTLVERQNEIPSLDQWHYILDSLYRYPSHRKRKIIDHLYDNFSLADTAHIQLNVNDASMGYIRINSLEVNATLDGVLGDAYPWRGMYFQDLPIHLEAIAQPGYHFVGWKNMNSTASELEISLDGDTIIEAVFAVDPHYNTSLPLYINEIMADNEHTIADQNQTYSDWIEIYNPNSRAIDLNNYYISDDLKMPYKHQFKSNDGGLTIPAYAYRLVWCSDHPERGIWHTNFKLSADGESLILSSPDSTLVDKVEFGQQGEDVSYGRQSDGHTQWVFFASPLKATPASSNNYAATIQESQLHYSIYPNPVQKGMTIQLSQVVDYKLYNSSGELVQSGVNTSQIASQSLQEGLYFLELRQGGMHKFLVK